MKTKIQNHNGEILDEQDFSEEALKLIETLRKRYNGTGRKPYFRDIASGISERFSGYYVTWVFINENESVIALRRKGGRKK